MRDTLRDLAPFIAHNSKKVRNTDGGVFLLVKLQAEFCNFTKISTLPWVFSRFLNFTNGTNSRKA